MPKYIPTTEDEYNTELCVICGREVIDEHSDTCCYSCEYQWQIFKKDRDDYEWIKMRNQSC